MVMTSILTIGTETINFFIGLTTLVIAALILLLWHRVATKEQETNKKSARDLIDRVYMKAVWPSESSANEGYYHYWISVKNPKDGKWIELRLTHKQFEEAAKRAKTNEKDNPWREQR